MRVPIVPMLVLAAVLGAARARGEEPKNVNLELYNTVRVEKDVPYLGGDRQEKMDLYLPGSSGKETFPAILVIHGGGWTGGSRAANREQQMGEVFAKAGFVAASIDYQLATTTKPSWPQCLYDCKTAVRFLKKNAARYRINPERIGVIGGSAGGHLALMVAYTGGNPKLDPPGPDGDVSTRVQAVVDLYGIPDVARFSGSRSFIGDRETRAAEYRAASPVTYATKDSVPLLMMHGTADKTVPVEFSDEFEKILKERGANYRYLRVEGAPHTFLINSKYGDFRPTIVGFFREHLGSPSGAKP